MKDWSAVGQVSDPKHWSSPLAETATAWFDAAMSEAVLQRSFDEAVRRAVADFAKWQVTWEDES